MSKSYHAVSTMPLMSSIASIQPPCLPEVIHINDPALAVMVDFTFQRPPFIAANQSLENVKIEMQVYHMPVLLVVDPDEKVIGIITAEDLLGEKPVKISQERRIARHEIEIEMLMTPCQALFAIDVADLAHAKVGHIIQTFRETKQHTLLVLQIDPKTNKQILRGLFSASLFSKQLDKDITQVLSEAQSIAELQHGMQR